MKTKRKTLAPDFSLTWHGSVSLLTPNNDKARTWLHESAPEDAQFLGQAMAIAQKYVQNVVDAAGEAGFLVD